MSTYDDASLIYYPSGYKAGTAYSLKPTDGSGDLTFTRASTATRVNESGLIEEVAANVPRLDNSQGGCSSLLLEPQRTNLINNSANVGAGFVVGNITLVLNNAAAPNGLVEADKFYPTTSGGNRWFYQAVTTSASSTISVFAKADGKDILYISSGASTDVSFDLSSGLVTYERSGWVGSIEDFGDGWYRCIAVKSSSVVFAAYGVADSSGGNSVTASGTDGILVWGMQCESSATYPTSYIPTSGTAVTRVADASVTTGLSSVIGQTEGVFYVEIAALANDNSGRYISISNSTNNNRIIIGFETTSDRIYVYVTSGGASQVSMFYEVPDILNFNKVAFKYKVNDFSLWVNGVERATDVSGSVPTSLTSITFNSGGGGNLFYGKMQNLMLFPSALSDTDLATLTTL